MHELDTHALGTVNFDSAGLIVAERDGRIVGFVHAGFGPDLPVESTRRLSSAMNWERSPCWSSSPRLDDPELVPG